MRLCDCAGGTWRTARVDFTGVIESRHSVRAFQERDVESVSLEAILRAAGRAPSAGNLQAYRVVVARASLVRKLLARAALGGEEMLRPVALLPLGYPAEDPRITPRRTLAEMVLDVSKEA